jgi:hypothetical protein
LDMMFSQRRGLKIGRKHRNISVKEQMAVMVRLVLIVLLVSLLGNANC